MVDQTAGGLAGGVLASMRRRLRRNTTERKPPVVICPYIHPHEAAEIRRKFRLDEPEGRGIEALLHHDAARIGPERAFEQCWSRFPDRDVIILHSDMEPLPADRDNAWHRELLSAREAMPDAGMIACNLFYPRTASRPERTVQCGGGTFTNGRIGHLHGPVLDESSDSAEGVPAALLEQVREVPWVTFGGVLIRRAIIDACGPFDRRYHWAYVMDVDYCFEARSRGFRLFQAPIGLVHEESRATKPILEADPVLAARVWQNMALFHEKWAERSDTCRPRPGDRPSRGRRMTR